MKKKIAFKISVKVLRLRNSQDTLKKKHIKIFLNIFRICARFATKYDYPERF